MNIRTTILHFLLITIGTLSSIFCFVTAFQIPVSWLLLFPCSLIPTAFLFFIRTKQENTTFDIIFLLYFLVLGIVFLLFRTIVPDALDSTIYYIQTILMKGNILPTTELYIPNTKFYAITPFFCFVTLLLSGLFFLVIERFYVPIIALLLSIPFVESGLFFGLVPKYCFFFPYVIFFIVCLSTVSRKKRTIPKGQCLVLTIILTICLGFSAFFLQKTEYTRPKTWDIIRDAMILKDYDTLSSVLGFSFSNPFSHTYSGMNTGNLKHLGNKVQSNKTALTVTLPKSDTTIYLKGYVGTQYTTNRWSVQPQEEFEQKLPLFFKSTSNKTTISPLDMLALEQTKSFATYDEMTIVPKSANKSFAYVPYAMLPNEEVTGVQDLYYIPKTHASYTIPYATPSTHSSSSFLSSMNYHYSEEKDTYSSYVTTYTQLPKGMESQLQATIKKIKRQKNTNTLSYPELVQQYLTNPNYFSYTLRPGKQKNGTDTTLSFLNTTHKGYCVHFASSATLLLRSLGIPARYVEGYIITPSNFSSGSYDKTSDHYTIDIPESNAHAWTEYYVNGEGWVVLDTTPSTYIEQLNHVFDEKINTTQTTTQEQTEQTTTNTQTETTTSTPEKATTEHSNTDKEKQQQKSSTPLIRMIPNVFLYPFVLCLILLLLIFIRRWIALYMREQQFHMPQANEAAIDMLEFLFYLFTIKQPSNAEQTILNERMKPLYDRAKYSQHTITKEQLQEIEQMVMITQQRLKQQLPFTKRIFHQFFAKKVIK